MSTRARIAEKIKEFRIARGMSVDDVGSAVGKSGKTISAWEVGRGQPDADKLIELCRLFDVSISDFYGDLPDGAITPSPVDCSLPYVGRIAAGTPLEAIQMDGERRWASPSVAERHPNAFLLMVRGDSMNLRYPEGGYVAIDPDERSIESGKVYAVLVNGHDATLKQVFVAGDTIVLHPLSSNPEHRDRSIDTTDADAPYFAVIGRAVWYVGEEE